MHLLTAGILSSSIDGMNGQLLESSRRMILSRSRYSWHTTEPSQSSLANFSFASINKQYNILQTQWLTLTKYATSQNKHKKWSQVWSSVITSGLEMAWAYSQAPFHIKNLFRNLEIFLSKVSTFTLEINFRKPTLSTLHSMFVNTGRLDQSQCFISEISSAKFHKIERVLPCEIKFRNLFRSKVDCSRKKFSCKKELIYINFEINI